MADGNCMMTCAVAARWFCDYATLTDPVRGLYLDNTSIARVIFNLLEGK